MEALLVSILKQSLFNIIYTNFGSDSDRVGRWLRNKLRKQTGSSKYMPHQGARECARRRRQMGKED